jgi:hypothetical protein
MGYAKKMGPSYAVYAMIREIGARVRREDSRQLSSYVNVQSESLHLGQVHPFGFFLTTCVSAARLQR